MVKRSHEDIDTSRQKILRELQDDFNRPQKVISHKVGVSEPTFSKEFGSAKANGIVKGVVAILDRSKLGFKALCFFRIECDNPRSANSVSEVLRHDVGVQEVHILDGPDSPLLVKVCARTTAELSAWQSKVLGHEGVKSVRGNVAMRTVHETHKVPV